MTDLLVVGAGAGGFGAALAAARLGQQVVLVERAPSIGGNAVRALVCGWEPGVGGTGVPLDLYREMRKQPEQVEIYGHGRHCCALDPELNRYPGAEISLRPGLRYADTLRRFGAGGPGYNYDFGVKNWFGVSFRPEACAAAMHRMLVEAGVQVLTSRSVRTLEAVGGRISSVTLDDGATLTPRAVVDATADALIAEMAGCELRQGREAASETGEPSAPTVADTKINGVSLLYRITPVTNAEPVPAVGSCWWRSEWPMMWCSELPGGDRVINMLPSMTGAEWLALGQEAATVELHRRVLAHWAWLQAEWPEFRRFRLLAIGEAVGVRESRRIRAERTLSELDVRGGLTTQRDDDLCALADHALDTHGHASAHGELTGPYGVPFRCLVPRGMRNLLVACRAAGFTAIAASSCRLTRTIMQLGQAAGTACALAEDNRSDPAEVSGPRLRTALADHGVQLSWPPDQALWRRVREADSQA